ncbi:MAG TPA: hypothetical protein VKR06_02385 [Ktedonosporobacter sp.]|nr:hypothetical protein [Ktedonosporobacter sp.]
MSKSSLFDWPMGRDRSNIFGWGSGFWRRVVAPTITIMSIVVLLSACSGQDPASNTAVNAGTTPTVADGATPTDTSLTATPGTTPTAAPGQTSPTNTPSSQPTPASQPTKAPVAVPTTAPVPTVVPTAPPVSPSGKTVTVWVQLTDSCKQALPGGSVVVNGPGIMNKVLTVSGSGLVGLNTYQHFCPVQRGTCVQTNTGCASVALSIPASGTATYTITPGVLAGSHYLGGIVYQPPTPLGANYAYVWCEGGSDCRAGPEVATVHVTSSGSVSATNQNVNPDGFRDAPWPTGGTFTATQGDPIMFHLFGASGPNDFTITCQNDGTHLLRDHMTGTPNWPHCNSGR